MSKKSILIIDDDKSLRRVIEFQLGEQGYRVLAADSGMSGLKVFLLIMGYFPQGAT